MLVNDEGGDELLATAEETNVIRAAVDPGPVANVIHPYDLLAGVGVTENRTGKHFSGAGGSFIGKYGSC